MMPTHEKGPYALYGQHRPRSACAFAQADLGLRCLISESVDTIVYVDKQRMFGSDCMDARANLELRCSHLV